MSNGSPEHFEDKMRKRMSALEIGSIIYVLLCIAVGAASLFIDIPFASRQNLPLLVLAGVLLIVAVVVLLRESSGPKN